MRNRLFNLLFPVCLLAGHLACGGGDSSPSPQPNTPITPSVIVPAPFSGPTRSLTTGVSVLMWRGGAQSALSLTFDDGFPEDTTIIHPILDQHGLQGTFFVPTGTMTGTWDQFRSLHAAGHEIGSHSVTHANLTTLQAGDENTPGSQIYELAHAKTVIETEIGAPCVSFGYPFSAQNPALVALVGQYYLAGRTSYLNTANPVWNGTTPTDLAYLDSYAPIFAATRTAEDDTAVQQTAQQVLGAAISTNTWAISMTHLVLPFDQVTTGWETQSTAWFTALCDWLRQKVQDGSTWVGTMGSVARYIRERDAVSVSGLTSTNTAIQFATTLGGSGLDATIFNQPIDLLVTVPTDWPQVQCKGPSGSVSYLLKDAQHRVLVRVVPGAGNVTLTKVNAIP